MMQECMNCLSQVLTASEHARDRMNQHRARQMTLSLLSIFAFNPLWSIP